MTDNTTKNIPTITYALHGNLYLNITSECTLRCHFCPKYHRTWEVKEYDLALPREPTAEEVIAAIGDPSLYNMVVFCGLGEPTQRFSTLVTIASWLKQQGAVVRVNTDGLVNLIEQRDCVAEMAAVVDAVSVSLNGQNEEIYIQHTRPRLDNAYQSMLDFVVKAKQSGMDVTITAIDGLEGVDIAQCAQIADTLGVKFRRRVLDDVG